MFCQYCLSSEPCPLVSMQTQYFDNGLLISYLDCFKQCKQIKIEDEQTAKICKNCISLLTEEYTLKQLLANDLANCAGSFVNNLNMPIASIKKEPELNIDSAANISAMEISIKMEPTEHQIFSIIKAEEAEPCLDLASSSAPETTNCNIIVSIPTMQEILELQNFDMLFLKQKYESGIKELDEAERVNLSSIIVKSLLYQNPNIILSNDDYEKLANAITSLFPLENKNTFFSKHRGRNRDGKLYNAFTNYRKKLLLAGIISSERQRRPAEQPSEEAKIKECLEVLQTRVPAWEDVQAKWRVTRSLRTEMMKKLLYTNEYLAKFPCLSDPRGYELLVSDGNAMHPDAVSKLPEISEKIIAYVINKKSKNPDIIAKLLLLKDDHNEVERQIISLLLLPYLFNAPFLKPKLEQEENSDDQVQPPKIKKPRCTQITKREVQQHFVAQYGTYSAFTSVLTSINVTTHNKAAPLQPRIAIIGGIENNESVLAIDQQQYLIPNILKAFDALFKTFLALNCPYPLASTNPCLFVQRNVYGIYKECDQRLLRSCFLTVENDIKNI